jgi:hypothetical protein
MNIMLGYITWVLRMESSMWIFLRWGASIGILGRDPKYGLGYNITYGNARDPECEF